MSSLKSSPSGMLRVAMLCLALAHSPCLAQNIWINEIHYDNNGTDQNEFLEVVLENPADYLLSDFTISLYSGSTLSVYNSKTLNTFVVGDIVGNFMLFHFAYPVDGIQNNTAGIAIDYQGNLIKLLSYEGTFTPTSGPAIGVLSEDIGIQESATTNVGSSLQLTGSGKQYDEFYWSNTLTATAGILNDQQTLTYLPTITTITPTTGYDFGLIAFGKSTQPKVYSLIGSNLTNAITITPPSGFELSNNNNFTSIFTLTSPLILSPIAGSLKPTPIYIRFTPTAPNSIVYNGQIDHASAGATNATISVTGQEGEPNAWINEFHYNDVGADSNEFIEVIIKNAANYNLQDFGIFLYDGSTGAVYDQETLNNFNAGQTFADYSIYALDFTDHSFFNIENGPDGIALSYQGNLIHFISYQGSFIATDGPAANQPAENIIPSENNSTPENSSIYMVNAMGPGSAYSDFIWAQGIGSNTMGLLNPLEVLPIVLKSFTVTTNAGVAELTWTTTSEINNVGFTIEKSLDGFHFIDIGFVKSQSNSQVSVSYHFQDQEFSETSYYRLRQVDFDNKITFSKIIIAETVTHRFHFFPNPVNERSRISIANLENDALLYTQIIDQRGVVVFSDQGSITEINKQLEDQFLEKNVPGIYYLKLFYEANIEVIKIIVL